MHPNPLFRADDEAGLALAAEIAFAHIFVATPEGPIVAHAPIVRAGDRAVRFHISRANRAARHLDGARLLVSLTGPQGYVSPNWYEAPANEVPTWNYVAVELEGVARALDDAELTEQLDALAAVHEPRVIPENPWTRAKLDDARFARMLGAIRGFEVAVDAVRATRKLSQNKSPASVANVIRALEGLGQRDLAAAMRAAR